MRADPYRDSHRRAGWRALAFAFALVSTTAAELPAQSGGLEGIWEGMIVARPAEVEAEMGWLDGDGGPELFCLDASKDVAVVFRGSPGGDP